MVHFTVYAFWNFGIIFYTALPEMHFLNFICYFLFYAIIRNLIITWQYILSHFQIVSIHFTQLKSPFVIYYIL